MVYGLGKLSLALDQAVHLVVVHRLHELQGNLVVFVQGVHHFLHTFLDDLKNGF